MVNMGAGILQVKLSQDSIRIGVRSDFLSSFAFPKSYIVIALKTAYAW